MNDPGDKVGRLDTLNGFSLDWHPHLVVMAGMQVGQSFPLEQNALIGRGHDVDILIDDDDVSRRHARIHVSSPLDLVLEDLNSRNGTFLNEVEVRGRVPLQIGDRITLGASVVLQVLRATPAESQVRQRQRLEALGRLTAGIAHDLNNMHGAILATLEYLATVPLTEQDEVRQCHDDLRAACRRVSELTPRLLAFSRSDSRAHVALKLSSIGNEVVQLVQRTFPRSIAVVGRIAPELEVLGDPVELHQVLMNLCLNASDSMPDGGQITISAAPVPDAEAARLELPMVRTKYVRVSVEDQGVGMDEATQARIFEPFFTTKGERGTGLGLATLREIVTSHRGIVRVASAPGSGSRFDIYLPRHSANLFPTRIETPLGFARVIDDVVPQDHVLLLVDDEPTVRRAFARNLRRHGYEILEASSGQEALALYDTHQPKPSAVILDVNMPGLGGDETLDRLFERDPQARVVVLTGQARWDSERLVMGQRVPYLPKPCPIASLIAALAELLSTSAMDEPPTAGGFEWGTPSR